MRGAMHDLRGAARTLRRAPAFAAVAAATLAVAIAVNGAMFSFLNAAFVRPLPFASPESLHHVRVYAVGAERFEPPPVQEVREALAPFGGVAAYTERAFVVATDEAGASGVAHVVQGSAADERLLAMLGVAPALGRSFDARDVRPGALPTVIVSDEFWRVRLGARPDAMAASVRIDGVDHSIIGIMPPRFGFPDFAQIWVPFTQADARLGDEMQVLLRLRDAGTADAASQSLEAAMAAGGRVARVRMRDLVPEGGALLVALLGAIGFVLLIACSNVANLVLARGTARRHEMAVRMALGASRARLLRYLSAEGALITFVAAVGGALGSVWLTELLVAAIPSDQLPQWFQAQLDATVLAYIAGIALVAVLVSAAMPAVTLTRGGLSITLTEAGGRSVGDASAGRLRSVLVAVQLALATTLLAGAGLLLRSFGAMRAIDPGYAADAVLELPTLRPLAAARDSDPFAGEAIASLAALPGVAASAATAPTQARGRVVSSANPDLLLGAWVEAVSPSYFDAIGLALLRGRRFRDGAAERDVAVISERTARLLFDGPDAALGATFSFESDDVERRFTVIGIAADRRARRGGSLEPASAVPHVYVPLELGDMNQLLLVARAATGSPLRLARAASDVLRQLDPNMVVRTPRSRGDVEREQAGDLRWFATVFGAFGGVALALATLGIWSVTAYTVSRRTREIGVRMTLGATGPRIAREMAAGIAPAAGIGLAIGMLGAFGVGWLLRGILYAVSPADPVTLTAVTLSFAAVTLLAAWLPARRAATVTPLVALRMD